MGIPTLRRRWVTGFGCLNVSLCSFDVMEGTSSIASSCMDDLALENDIANLKAISYPHTDSHFRKHAYFREVINSEDSGCFNATPQLVMPAKYKVLDGPKASSICDNSKYKIQNLQTCDVRIQKSSFEEAQFSPRDPVPEMDETFVLLSEDGSALTHRLPVSTHASSLGRESKQPGHLDLSESVSQRITRHCKAKASNVWKKVCSRLKTKISPRPKQGNEYHGFSPGL